MFVFFCSQIRENSQKSGNKFTAVCNGFKFVKIARNREISSLPCGLQCFLKIVKRREISSLLSGLKLVKIVKNHAIGSFFALSKS